MDQDIYCQFKKGLFIYRVGGVILHKGRVLLVTEEDFDFWYLPGGKATLFEASKESLQREINEELGIKPEIDRLLWISESMFHFENWDSHVHQLAFNYLVNFPENASIFSQTSFTGKELNKGKEKKFYLQWFDIDKLSEITLLPQFLVEGLQELPKHPQHIIVNEISH